MSEKYNFSKVFKVFRTNYKLVPLEVFKSPYNIFVSTLLSARTNDDTTLKVCRNLFLVAPDIKILTKLNVDQISKLIYPVGFYKTKAINLKKASRIIVDEYGGEIPKTKTDLIRLPGVGIKTANLVINRAFGIPAISVDTHVHKISNLLGWVNTKTPEQTLDELEKILPKKYWTDINKLFVSIGRQYNTQLKLRIFLKENGLV